MVDGMTDELFDHPTNMPELYEAIEAAWRRLNATLDGVDEREAIEQVDANGWNARDHVVHVIAWERSVLYLLNRRPRHEAIGVSDDLLRSGDVDEINEEIRAANDAMSWEQTRADLRDGHDALLARLKDLDWDDMERPYSSYLPDKPGEEGEWPVGVLVNSNASLHFDEHRQWIEELLASDR